MLRSRFLWKLCAGYVVVILVTSLTIGFLGSREVETTHQREVESRLAIRATALESMLTQARAADPRHDLQAFARRHGPSLGARITLIAADGRVVGDSQGDPRTMDDHAGRPEIVQARTSGKDAYVRRRSVTTGLETAYLARLLPEAATGVRYLRVAEPDTPAHDRQRAFGRALWIGSGAAIVVACVLGLLFARQVTGPLRSMTQVAEAMAAGDYQRRVRAPQEDEVGRLADTFNSMADQLRLRVETISTDRNKLRAILGGMIEGVIAVDGNERVLHMNHVAANLLGESPADAVGRPIWQVTRLVEITAAIGETIQYGVETVNEIVLPGRPDDRVIEAHGSPLRDHTDAVAGAVLVLHDVTQLRKLEAVRRDFVANVSHELKTPLAAIRGLVETMLDDPEMPDDVQRRFLTKACEQTMRLSTLVRDLLALSRIESKESPLDMTELDLRVPVRESARSLVPHGHAKGLRMRVELPDAPVQVRGDAEALRQVVDNLVDNAIKYTPAGGEVRVRLQQNGSTALLEVQDTGIGIEARDVDRIFERFYRVDKARSRELGSTGLGLAIVKNVTLRFGGHVSVDSVPGKGSTFRVTLPCVPSTEPNSSSVET